MGETGALQNASGGTEAASCHTALRKGGRAFPSRPLPHIPSFPLEFLLKVRNSGVSPVCSLALPLPGLQTRSLDVGRKSNFFEVSQTFFCYNNLFK